MNKNIGKHIESRGKSPAFLDSSIPNPCFTATNSSGFLNPYLSKDLSGLLLTLRPPFLDTFQNHLLFLDHLILVHGRNAGKLVGQAQFFILGFSHRMVGQYIQGFQIAELADEISQLEKVFIVIGYAWNNNMAYPHIHMIFIQVSGKGQDAVIGLGRQFLVLFRVDMLNVQHYQVGQCHQAVQFFNPCRVIRFKSDAGTVDTGMHPFFFGNSK